jgi:hypothetical protein
MFIPNIRFLTRSDQRLYPVSIANCSRSQEATVPGDLTRGGRFLSMDRKSPDKKRQRSKGL